MGIELAKLVAGRLGGLPGPAYKALNYMAVIALDQPNGRGQPARLYFGGREGLALALGYKGFIPAAERAVKRALTTLRSEGLISDVARAQPGRRQSYRLNLTLEDLREWGTPSDPHSETNGGHPTSPISDRMGDTQGPPVGDTSWSEWGTPGVPNGGRPVSPQGQSEEEEDLSQDCTAIASAPTTDRVPEPVAMDAPTTVQPHAWRPDVWGLECLDCGRGQLHQVHLRSKAAS